MLQSITLNLENVQSISEDDVFGRFITVTNVEYLQNTIQSLVNKKYSYVVVCSKKKLQDIKNWKIITQHKFNDTSYLAMIKKVNHVKGSFFIETSKMNFRIRRKYY